MAKGPARERNRATSRPPSGAAGAGKYDRNSTASASVAEGDEAHAVVVSLLLATAFATTLLAFNYLADHFAPSLALAAPLFLLWPDVHVLLQAVTIAGAGVGIFLATRQHSRDDQGWTYSQRNEAPIVGVPTFTWAAGQPLRADETLAAPPPTQWSRYHLEVGWYDWRTNQHLLLPNGSDHATLLLPG